MFICLSPPLMQTTKCHKMFLPVGTCNTCILHRLTTMDHHVISNVDSNMTRPTCVIGALEEDQVSRFCFRWRYLRTVRTKFICCTSSNIPSISTIIDNPAYKSGTIKSTWGITTPDIRNSQKKENNNGSLAGQVTGSEVLDDEE